MSVAAAGPSGWLVTGALEAAKVLRDDRSYGPVRAPGIPDVSRPVAEREGDAHRRLRRALDRVLKPPCVAELSSVARAEAAALVERLPRRGPVDLGEELAKPLPRAVIGALCGIERDGRDAVFDLVAALLFEQVNTPAPLLGRPTDRTRAFEAWAAKEFGRRIAHAGDDGLSRLLSGEDVAEQLVPDELTVLARLLCQSAISSPVRVVSSAFEELAAAPRAWRALREGRVPVAAAVEETLRLHPPVELVTRRCRAPDNLGGAEIRPGDHVTVHLRLANRDPDHEPRAGRFLLDRRRRGHLAFGRGPHACPGAPLARIIVTAAIEALLTKVQFLSLAPRFVPTSVPIVGAHGPRRVVAVLG